MKPYLHTRSGKDLFFLDPTPEMIDIYDICAGLSRQPRWGGQALETYSVAMHSINVANAVRPQFAFEALLHDATEAYICDIGAPLKAFLPEYREIERKLDRVIRAKFNLPLECSPEVKEADHRLLSIEAYALMKNPRPDWGILPREECAQRLTSMNPELVPASFMSKFYQLEAAHAAG